MRVFDEQQKEYCYTYQDGVLTVKKEAVTEGIEYLEFDFGDMDAKAGDEGYYLIGDTYHTGTHLVYFKEKQNADHVIIQRLMPLFGVKKRGMCRLVICRGMAYHLFLHVGVQDGGYDIRPRIRLLFDAPYEDIVFRVIEFPDGADYNDMAAYYRQLRISDGCVPLAEREKTNPYLAYATDAPEIRIRMGWKPVPSPIDYQTEENEPPVHVACTFRQVSDFADRLYAAGVDQAQICLVGWNKGGHDGRYPDVFPVEESMGGEEELRKLISHVQDLGYKIVCHTNSTDCYSISERFSEQDVVKRKDGTLLTEGTWGGGKMHRLCAVPAYEQAKEILPQIRALGFEGLHYIDVISSILPIRCYDQEHPLTQQDTAALYEKIGRLTSKIFGGFSSEGTMDYTVPYLDYGLYVNFSENKHDFFDVEIPFFELVYHGILLYNASTHTLNYPAKRPYDYLKYLEYGCRPSFYIYSKFIESGCLQNFLGADDLRIDTPEALELSVQSIAKSYAEYQNLRYLQREYMLRHDMTGDVHTVTYSDGSTVAVDYSHITVAINRGRK